MNTHIYKKGYLYKITGRDFNDGWEALVVFETATDTNFKFLELEIFWNGIREEPGNYFEPSFDFVDAGNHQLEEIGPLVDHPEYFL